MYDVNSDPIDPIDYDVNGDPIDATDYDDNGNAIGDNYTAPDYDGSL